jgi:hypothetical protein
MPRHKAASDGGSWPNNFVLSLSLEGQCGRHKTKSEPHPCLDFGIMAQEKLWVGVGPKIWKWAPICHISANQFSFTDLCGPCGVIYGLYTYSRFFLSSLFNFCALLR